MELLAKLGINWQILLAQVVNFAILLGILTKFLYRPILSLLDERTDRIKRSLADTDEIALQKKNIQEFAEQERRRIDRESGLILEKVRTEASALKESMVRAAEKEAEQIVERGREKVGEERRIMQSEVQSATVRMVLQMTEKLLRREFSSADEQRLLLSLEKEISFSSSHPQ